MIICGLTDLDRMILHLPVMLLLGGIGLILSLTSFWPVIAIGAILGMMTLMLVLSAINKMYRCWRRTDDFGDGDIWLMGAVCCWLGPISAVIVFLMACGLVATWGLILIAKGKEQVSSPLPFGVFVSIFLFAGR